MSRWSAPEPRGQADPLAALVAVAAVGLGLSLYAGVLDASAPTPADRTPETVLATVHDAVAPNGTASPGRVDEGLAAVPEGRQANVSLRTGGRTWTAGPTPPPGGNGAARPVAVRTEWGVDPGRLEVVVWS